MRFVVGALALSLALMAPPLASPASAAPSPIPATYDLSGSNDTVLEVRMTCDYSVLDPCTSVSFWVEVKDRVGNPIEGAMVSVQTFGVGEVNRTSGETCSDGLAAFTFKSQDVGRDSETWIVAVASKDGYTEGYSNIDITTVTSQIPEKADDFLAATIGLLSIGAIFSAELGRYGLAKLVFPLYTRVKKEEVLEHFVRGQIYGFIVSNPGEHYTLIREALRVNNGTLSHHLRTLEVQGFIKSRRDGQYRRFYPIRTASSQDDGQKLSELQVGILDIIRQTGADGASQRFIADMLDTSQQTVSYNLRALGRSGVVRMEHDGRRVRYYILNT
jgi:predicted transcriptional regulator